MINTPTSSLTGTSGSNVSITLYEAAPSEEDLVRKPSSMNSDSKKLTKEQLNYIEGIAVTDTGQLVERTVRRVKHEYLIDLFGDTFIFSSDAEGCYIHHRKWPILGEGQDLGEATKDLLNNIRLLKGKFSKAKLEELDLTAIEFREYLLSNLNV